MSIHYYIDGQAMEGKEKMNFHISNLFKGDKVIWMIFFLLCMVSIVEVFSASSVLTYRSQNYLGPISYHTFTIIVGAVVAIIVQNIPYQKFRQMIPFLTLFSAFTLLWVLLAGTKVGDAGRWLYLFGFSFQPSEIAKGTIESSGPCQYSYSNALFNMMVAVGLVPVTGQPLPLVSKGGTSTIINCAYIGAILSISRLR